MPKTEVIVARYNEDTDWVKNCGHPFVVYTKIAPLVYQDYMILVELDDFGREASTWLKHIINCYESLADFNIFVQGKYEDHCPELFNKLNFDKPFTWLCNETLTDNWSGKITQVYSELFPLRECPPTFTFGRGGMFMVSKELIHTHSVEYYQCILSLMQNSYNNEIWAQYLERFWDKIFYNN